MTRLIPFAVPITLAAVAATSSALPPGAAVRGLRDGANHRAGDDSFVATHGRAPDRDDGEQLRMRTHLQYIRAQLAAKPATRPELAARRAELLAYLDDYVAKGTTPVNTRVPWRTPVFIDDFGTICAVGYLIERSVGRELPERIATTHRHAFLEDIAAAVPEVRAWVEGSGLTLEELASIQPGYEEPMVESWGRWTIAATRDGAYSDEVQNGTTAGAFRKGRMAGAWTRRDAAGRVIGTGELIAGRGTWHSLYPDGKRMAEGPFVANDPHGSWTFFHPSGNVAAEGRFERGYRDGDWKFFYDTKHRTPLATGPFDDGSQYGDWKHYDEAGTLLARSRDLPSMTEWEPQRILVVVPGPDKVLHEVHSYGGVDASSLDALSRGEERLYVSFTKTFDADGFAFEKVEGVWQASDCRWSKKRKRIARNGDVTTLHRLLRRDGQNEINSCVNPTPVSAERGRQLDSLLVPMTTVRAPSPEFVKQLTAAYEASDSEEYGSGVQDVDLVRVIEKAMGWYIEWPHIDGRFIQVFHTLPGHGTRGTWEAVAAEEAEAASAPKLTNVAN